MPSRSEPEILADLIRLHTRLEREDKALGLNTAADAELIEQARAALHRYVVARGKLQLTMPAAPLTLWTGACFAAGALGGAAALALAFPPWLPIIAAALSLVGASIIIDRKHL